MITALNIEGFRCFDKFEMDGLSRVNLLLGNNNSGKTSALEALEILMGEGDPGAVLRSSLRRGEFFPSDGKSRRLPLDVRHLFYGRDIEDGTTFSVRGEGDSTPQTRVTAHPGPEQGSLFAESKRNETDTSLELEIRRAGKDDPRLIDVSPPSGTRRAHMHRVQGVKDSPTQFVSTYDFSAEELSSLWSDIALEDDEQRVIEALNVIEPDIDRIAFLPGFRQLHRSFAGFFVRLKSSEGRLPIGSLGDGLKRLLTLALHLVTAQGGILLVDEIDTGLHHSVLQQMWELLITTARKLDIQVFATTHSLDCVRTLAWLCEEQPNYKEDIRVHRLERNRESSELYEADEIIAAVEHDIEVR